MKQLYSPLNAAIFLTLFALCMCASAKYTPERTYMITGYVKETNNYCGGAQPTKEMLERFNTPIPIPFAKLGLKKFDERKKANVFLKEIIADSNGRFSTELPPGKYCVVEAWKLKPLAVPASSAINSVDTTCYKNLYNSCDFEINVSDHDTTNLVFQFSRPCYNRLPCLTYKGPLVH